ncbi:hypothetical protein [Echinicola pacifica]|uniref:hypothetical protein n=1 Tax=Echinicola pacifica TaxID=346377 RepID=UPI0003775EC2|nr:hypothetical protein [Echinicola pacifica]
MNIVNLKKKTGISWKEKVLVYLATLLICILAANFKTRIQHFTGDSQEANIEISTIEE